MANADFFQAHVPLLFSIAYRMLGSASDAEDVVQDAWVRFSRLEEEDVRSPKALATTIVTRLCLDRLKSARASREEYVGPWLPEPVLTSGGEPPDVLAQRSESVTLAFLLLLETLSPEERAVFLLKDVFDYDHSEIAETLGTTAANSRQLLHRAKEKIAAADKMRLIGKARPKTETTDDNASGSRERRDVAERFAAAFSAGDPGRFADMLAEGVTFVSDGGGKVSAARRPLVGRESVINFLTGLHRSARATGLAAQASLSPVEVNGEPAVVLRVAGRLDSVYALSMIDGAVAAINVIRNPDKLKYIERQLSSIM
jgi:RNA polymerase sigma-70 factor (ECF subfamily)